jgi:hypothetical protein
MTAPMFVAYQATVNNQTHTGWVVASECRPIRSAADMEELTRYVEDYRKFPRGSLVITNFRRMED